jgi:hypothetical protein
MPASEARRQMPIEKECGNLQDGICKALIEFANKVITWQRML